ncbi:MAG: hypothetical protein V4478_00945 [Patescibacteria group bacterium]
MNEDDNVKKTPVHQEIDTNAEYANLEDLDQIDGKDGEPLDAIEQDQSEESFAGQDGAKDELQQELEGDRDSKDNE